MARTADKLPSPQARFAGIPHVSGRDGGHNLNLHEFARQGVVLLGRLSHASGDTIWLAPDLKQSLAKADQFEAELVKMIDGFIERAGLDAPEERLPELRDGYAVHEYAELSLKSAGITTIIWAMGYNFDFSLVELPVVDSFGYPLQQRGVSAYAGLYFVGLPWLTTQKSGVLLGVGDDAAHIAAHIAAHRY
jgi:putative flavoprotein involved in K+ transport